MLHIVLQNAPQHSDVEGEIAFFYETILPETLNQLVL
jgi:hypothetical protein